MHPAALVSCFPQAFKDNLFCCEGGMTLSRLTWIICLVLAGVASGVTQTTLSPSLLDQIQQNQQSQQNQQNQNQQGAAQPGTSLTFPTLPSSRVDQTTITNVYPG